MPTWPRHLRQRIFTISTNARAYAPIDDEKVFRKERAVAEKNLIGELDINVSLPSSKWPQNKNVNLIKQITNYLLSMKLHLDNKTGKIFHSK